MIICCTFEYDRVSLKGSLSAVSDPLNAFLILARRSSAIRVDYEPIQPS